ncbi:MAG: hypothetical protein ACTSSE_07100 [Candidatus Thorarchaeota archaeon]
MIKQDEISELPEDTQEISTSLFPQKDSSNEKLLLILNKESGLAPYSHEFIEGFQDPQILSSFISAISSFMGEMTGQAQSQWKTVFGSDSVILVENGEWSVGVLVAAKETTEIRSKLRSTLREFEDCFEFLRDIEGIQNIFSDFDSYVRRIFVDERITDRTLITKIPEWRNCVSTLDLPSTIFEVVKILSGFKDSTTVEEIVKFHNMSIERVIEVTSIASWNRLVELTYIPSDNDILNLSDKASTMLFKKNNPLRLSTTCLRTIALFDGRTPLSQYIDTTDTQDKKLLFHHLGFLINRGLVQRISIEKRAVLFDECLLSNLVTKGAEIVGSRKMKQYFEQVYSQGCSMHPRVSRIILLDNMNVKCILEDSMTPDDLDDMFEALEYFIEKMTKHLTRAQGVRITENLIERIQKKCQAYWIPYLSDAVI